MIFKFLLGPLGSQVSDPPPGVGDGVSRCLKVSFLCGFEDVHLDFNNLKSCLGNRFLDASTHLYKRVCSSVAWSFGPSRVFSYGGKHSNYE